MRLRVTDLDAWQFWQSSGQPFEEFLRHMRRERPPTPLMERGIAFHSAMEQAIKDGVDEHHVLTANGWVFPIARGADVEIPVAGCRSEEAGSLRYEDIDVTLTGRADVMCESGPSLWDFKTTQRSPDLEAYYWRWQWRAYLEMFEAYKFTYLVFKLMPAPEYGMKELGNQQCAMVVGADHLDLYRYAGMGDDVRGAVHSLSKLLREVGWQ